MSFLKAVAAPFKLAGKVLDWYVNDWNKEGSNPRVGAMYDRLHAGDDNAPTYHEALKEDIEKGARITGVSLGPDIR